MGGLAHHLETAGIATTQVSLVRLHSEIMRPPRALWVSFELGRPFGPPDDAAFQRRVVRAALELLEAEAGPLLVDYPEDAPPSSGEEGGWACPISFSAPREALDDNAELAERL
ncbi:MAG: selenoprotein B, partial [Gammaproteobacteria bacterium]